MRLERGQLGDALVERRAVVDAGAEHQLRVRLDAHVGQAAQLRHDLRGARVAQQAAAQRRVGGVDRDVQRAEALLDDALPVVLFEVGQGDEAAVEEAVAVVVVLDVEAGPQAGRVLVDEAERAVVVAALDAVEGGVVEDEAEVCVLVLDAPSSASGSPVALHLDVERFADRWNW